MSLATVLVQRNILANVVLVVVSIGTRTPRTTDTETKDNFGSIPPKHIIQQVPIMLKIQNTTRSNPVQTIHRWACHSIVILQKSNQLLDKNCGSYANASFGRAVLGDEEGGKAHMRMFDLLLPIHVRVLHLRYSKVHCAKEYLREEEIVQVLHE